MKYRCPTVDKPRRRLESLNERRCNRMRTAATAILITLLCFSCSRWTPEGANASNPTRTATVSDEVLQVSQALVGKRITIHGKLSLRCKVGACIGLDNRQTVYLVPTGSFTWGKPHSQMEDKLVGATRTLRFAQRQPLNLGPANFRNLGRGFVYFMSERGISC